MNHTAHPYVEKGYFGSLYEPACMSGGSIESSYTFESSARARDIDQYQSVTSGVATLEDMVAATVTAAAR